MQEHLIPQDVSNYRFHLIGELDLIQFLQILAGLGIAFIIYQLGLPGFIAWPLIFLVVGIGLLAAFIPIAAQPLSHWIRVFIKNLNSPTRFYWRKEAVIPSYFNFELPPARQEALFAQETFNTSPLKKHQAYDYFTSLDSKNPQVNDDLEVFDHQKVQSVLEQFATTPQPKVSYAPKKVIRKPIIQEGQSLRVRPMIVPSQENINSFIETQSNSLFKPTQITTKITAVPEKNLSWPQANPIPPTPSPTS